MQPTDSSSNGAGGQRCLVRDSRPTARSGVASNYLTQHLGEEVYVADIAIATDLSTSWFAHQFTRDVGSSPYKTLHTNEDRTSKRAVGWHRSLPVKEIAGRVGFLHVETFIRTFRTISGVSPGQYRRTMREREVH